MNENHPQYLLYTREFNLPQLVDSAYHEEPVFGMKLFSGQEFESILEMAKTLVNQDLYCALNHHSYDANHAKKQRTLTLLYRNPLPRPQKGELLPEFAILVGDADINQPVYSFWHHPRYDRVYQAQYRTWYGRWYGYAECCIEMFNTVVHAMQHPESLGGASHAHLHLARMHARSEGYVCQVCETHARQAPAAVLTKVLEHRLADPVLLHPGLQDPVTEGMDEVFFLVALQRGLLAHGNWRATASLRHFNTFSTI